MWSACNGKRDPAAKISKKQLATPAAFDHDYNFLTGLERVLDRNERSAKDQKLHEKSTGSAFRSSKVQDYVTRVGLEIVRAPAGLSRSRTNETRWVNGKEEQQRGIRWTMEWILPDGQKTTAQCMEHVPLSQLYREALAGRHSPLGKKRKRGKSEQEGHSQAHDSTTYGEAEKVEGENSQDEQQPDLAEVDPAKMESENDVKVTDQKPYFYLVKPLSSSPHTVLIPCKLSTTLHTLLEGKTILEYPTMQVLNSPADDLPLGFQTEAEYKKEHQQLIEEIEEQWSLATPAAPTSGRPQLKSQEEMFNESKVLESLRRDVSNV